jgi:hypothetical protein
MSIDVKEWTGRMYTAQYGQHIAGEPDYCADCHQDADYRTVERCLGIGLL